MDKLEEIIKQVLINRGFPDWEIEQMLIDAILLECMKQAYNAGYNKALLDAVEVAEVEMIFGKTTSQNVEPEIDFIVDPESILSLTIK